MMKQQNYSFMKTESIKNTTRLNTIIFLIEQVIKTSKSSGKSFRVRETRRDSYILGTIGSR